HVLPWVLFRSVDFGGARRDGLTRQYTRALLQVLLGIAERHADSNLTRQQGNEIILADPLEDQEGEGLRATVGHQMRSRRPDDIDFARLQIHFLFWILQEKPHLAFQNVKSV